MIKSIKMIMPAEGGSQSKADQPLLAQKSSGGKKSSQKKVDQPPAHPSGPNERPRKNG